MGRFFLYILCAITLLTFMVPPHLYPANYPADDAFFYLQVASNIDDGLGSTFNQLTKTNGYHPLWMLCCVLCSRLAGGNKTMALHFALGLQQVLALLIVWLFFKVCRFFKGHYAYLALPLLLLYFSTRLYLSEAYLNGFFVMLTLAGTVYIACSEEQKPASLYFLAGISGGLALLARLDNVFVIGILFIMTALFQGREGFKSIFRRQNLLRDLLLGVGCLLIFIPYLAYNQKTFGHWVPVSGAIKSTLPAFVFHLNGLSGIGKVGVCFAVLNGFLCFTPLCNRRSRFVLSVFSLGVLLHAAQIVFTTNHHTDWPWYYMSAVLGMCFTLVLIGGKGLAGMSKWNAFFSHLFSKNVLLPLVLFVCIAVNGYAALRYRSSAPTIGESFTADRLRTGSDIRWQQQIASWLQTNLPPETAIAVYDWPGMFAFTSGMHILPIDGLINDYKYNDDVMREGIDGFLKKRDVLYWLGPVDPSTMEQQAWYTMTSIPEGQEITVNAPLYRTHAGAFRVADRDQIVRFREVIPHQDLPDLALWSIQ